jgi:hypothetical protein
MLGRRVSQIRSHSCDLQDGLYSADKFKRDIWSQSALMALQSSYGTYKGIIAKQVMATASSVSRARLVSDGYNASDQ